MLSVVLMFLRRMLVSSLLLSIFLMFPEDHLASRSNRTKVKVVDSTCINYFNKCLQTPQIGQQRANYHGYKNGGHRRMLRHHQAFYIW